MKAKNLGRTILLAILLAVLTTGTAFASEGEEIEVIGTVVSIDPETFILEIEVEDDEGNMAIYLVQLGQNFNFETVVVGDMIEVKGTLNEGGALELTELKIQVRARDRVKLQDGEVESYYCTAEDQYHPVAEKIAATYSVDYSVIEGYLCGENPVPLGQIMLAMQTAALTDGDFTEYLDGFDGISWGQIWQEEGLQGKPDKGTPPGQLKKQNGEGDPEEKTPPGQQKKEGEGSLECENGEILCEAVEWIQSKSQRGKK